MPTKPLVQCASNVSWSRIVTGSKPGSSYEVTYGELAPDPLRELPFTHGFSCSCPAYKFRKDVRAECKHILAVKGQWCGWHQQFEGGETVDGKCPKCGGPTSQVMCAV